MVALHQFHITWKYIKLHTQCCLGLIYMHDDEFYFILSEYDPMETKVIFALNFLDIQNNVLTTAQGHNICYLSTMYCLNILANDRFEVTPCDVC
jgi:hypothetical protein